MRIEDSSMASATSAAGGDAEKAAKLTELREATQQFEAIFVGMMLESMRKAVPKSGFLHGGMQEEIFQTFLDNSISENIAARGNGLGIGDMMYKYLVRSLERAVAPGTSQDRTNEHAIDRTA
ncbi:MAG: rod-binding protein [Planctomycetota bacterium]|nr:rod-binding protein [Planctomycetota bacterium]